MHQHSSAGGTAPGQLSRQVSGVRAEDSTAGLAASKSTNIIAVDAGGNKLKRGGFMVSRVSSSRRQDQSAVAEQQGQRPAAVRLQLPQPLHMLHGELCGIWSKASLVCVRHHSKCILAIHLFCRL
jgi:hypothetical protein